MKTVYCYQHGFLHIGLNLTQLYLNHMRWTVHLKLFFVLSRNSISHFLLFLGFLSEKYQTNQCLFFFFFFMSAHEAGHELPADGQSKWGCSHLLADWSLPHSLHLHGDCSCLHLCQIEDSNANQSVAPHPRPKFKFISFHQIECQDWLFPTSKSWVIPQTLNRVQKVKQMVQAA